MEITLSLKYSEHYQTNRYYMEANYIKDNHRCRTTRNNQDKIIEYIKKIITEAKLCEIYPDKLVIACNRKKLSLPKFNEYSKTDPLYIEIGKQIKSLPKVKYGKINYKKIAALALATTLTFTVMSSAVSATKLQISTDNKQVLIDKTFKKDNPEIVMPEIQIFDKIAFDLIQQLKNPISEADFDLETRIMQTSNLYNQTIENNELFPIATKMSDYALNRIVNFINSDVGRYTEDICRQFGEDSYMQIALLMAESSLQHQSTIPGGSDYNGYAVGISQLETPNPNKKVTAFNYEYGMKETMVIDMPNATNLESNIKMGVMAFQERKTQYHNNLYLTLQSYNCSTYFMDLVIDLYAEEIGSTKEAILENYEDNGWIKYVQQGCNNPKQFANNLDISKYPQHADIIKALRNWKGKYGNANYIQQVLSYYLGIQSQSRIGDEMVTTNLLTNEQNRQSIDSKNKTF